WKTAFGVVKGARGFVLHRQLHGAAGIWGWIVFVIVSFTGVAISFPQSYGPAFQTLFGGSPQERIAAVEEAAGIGHNQSNRAVELALAAAPNAHVSGVFPPGNAKQPYRIQLAANDAIAGAPAINIAVDPYKGEAISVRDPRNYALGDSIMAWQRTIHDGRA